MAMLPRHGTRVRVHFNLHRGDWSVIDLSTPGQRTVHVTRVELVDAQCRVQQGGRAAVLRSGVRSVHAYVVGRLVATGAERPASLARFGYNPFDRPAEPGAFRRKDNGAPVAHADRMRFDEEGAWYA